MSEENIIKLSDDLFSDLERKKQPTDILNHSEIAQQLKEIISKVDTPANIALFGSWGSGKTWICNWLENKIYEEQEHKDKVHFYKPLPKEIKFVKYDAFKYIELPLLRSFIKVIAENILDKDKCREIEQKLNNSFEISRSDNRTGRSKAWFIAIPIILILFFSFIAKVVDWFPILEQGSTLAAVVALITYLFGSHQLSRKQVGPKDGDEFEAIFKELIIERMECERLVIFIDELDRCSAKEMVNTLDAIRAFFDIERCVIIVAADRNVLELALDQEARQSTPYDEDYPYYSTGGAYIEKVFQYQFNIPPLWKNQGIACAEKLIESKNSKFWNKIKSEGELRTVIEILIPDYVTSPRRVKNILNTFVTLCHLALEKDLFNKKGLISNEEIRTMAKFACLRVEFPMFARDMFKDPKLPQYVLQYLDPTEVQPNIVDDDTWNLAKGYANKTRETTKFIWEEFEKKKYISGIETIQGQQLLSYLSKTKHIDCPSFSMVYFDQIEDNYGKLGILRSEKILSFAISNEEKRFKKEMDELNESEKPEALSMLFSNIGDEPSTNSNNIIDSVLLVLSSNFSSVESLLIDNLIEKILDLARQDEKFFSRNDPSLVWNLCLRASDASAIEMRKYLVTWCKSLEQRDLGRSKFLLTDIKTSFDSDDGEMGCIFLKWLESEQWEDALEILVTSPDRVMQTVITSLDAQVKENAFPIRYDMLRALAQASSRKGQRIQDQILSILVSLKLEESQEAVDSILSSHGFRTKQAEVLTYVFNSLLKSIEDNEFPFDITMYEKWMKHVSVDNLQGEHIKQLGDLFSKTIGAPKIALREENKAIADLLNNFISDLQQPDQGNVKADIRKLLEQHNANLPRESAQVTMQYNDMLKGYDLLDQTQEASDLLYVVLDIIKNPVAESDAETEAIDLLSNKFRGEFIELSSRFTEKQIFSLLQALMQCTWIENKEASRAALIKDVSNIIDKLPERDVKRVDFSRVILQLKHYRDKAVEPTLKWMMRFKYPNDAALVFRTLVEMDLLKNSSFSRSVGSLYRSWQDEQAKVFWNECFKYVASSCSEDEEDNILALLAWGEGVDMGQDEKRFVDWLVGQSRRSSSLKERRLLLLLINNVDINDRSSMIKLIDEIIFPLFDVTDKSDYRNVLLGIKEVEKISRDVFEDIRDQVENYFKRLLYLFPELGFSIKNSARYWNLSLGDEPRSA